MSKDKVDALEEVRTILAPLKVYTPEKILGVGGAGYVLRVRHRALGKRAMKLVHPKHLAKPDIRQRFDTEALVMHRLTHPNIVKVYEMGEVGDYPYLVMDLLEGGTLETHVKRFGKMPPRQAVRVAIAILRGLQAAHEAGVVHRDIKPQNILFDTDGTPKITDFGIARIQEGTQGVTQEGWTVGTWSYMAPEQLYGRGDLIDPRTDLHAVGVTLYEMLTRGPHGKTAFHRQLEEDPGRLVGVPDVLQMVIRVATSKEREGRYESATLMADELASYLSDDALPEDPVDTPELGSAPDVSQEELDEAALARAGRRRLAVEVGGDAPSTRVQPGYGVEASSPDGVSASVGSSAAVPLLPMSAVETASGQGVEPPPMGTLMPSVVDSTAQAKRIAAIRVSAMRRALLRGGVVALALIALALVIARMVTREPVVEFEGVSAVAPSNGALADREGVEVLPEPATTDTLPDLRPDELEPVVVVEPEPTPTPVAAREERIQEPRTPVPSPILAEAIVVPSESASAVALESLAQVQLLLEGDTQATVTLTGEGGSFTITQGSHDVPQGTYHVSIDMPVRETPKIGMLTVEPGINTIRCRARVRNCSWRQ